MFIISLSKQIDDNIVFIIHIIILMQNNDQTIMITLMCVNKIIVNIIRILITSW